MQLVKTKFIFCVVFFLSSCFIGPVKELKFQIEDSWDDSISYASNPVPLNKLDNKFEINILQKGFFDGVSRRNFKLLIDNQNIFYISTNGILSFYNLETNEYKDIYKHNINISSGISGNSKNLFFVDVEGYLCSFSFDHGLNWRTFVGEVFSPPILIFDKVVTKNTNNEFIALNIIDGSVLWSYKLPTPPLSIRSWGPMSSADNLLFSGGPSGKTIAINALNGSLIWETTFSQPRGSSEIERSNDVTSEVALDDYAVYVASSNGNTSALSKVDGSILWDRPLSSFAGLSLYEDNLFVTHSSGSIYNLSKITNKIIWRNSSYTGRDTSKPIFFDNYIVVTDFEGWIHFLNKDDGLDQSRFKIAESTLLEPIIFNDRLFFVSVNGEFNLLSLSNSIKVNEQNQDKNLDNKDLKSNNEDSIIDNLIFWD